MSSFEFAGSHPEDTVDAKCAIDDSVDEDEDTVEIRRIQSAEHKRQRKDSTALRVQSIVPFHFSPLFLPLTVSSLNSCQALEDAAFTNPDHRCYPEKFEYRLSQCSDICFGLFCSIKPSEAEDFGLETFAAANPVETNREDGEVLVLCAHVVSTMGKGPVVTDDDMKCPQNWRDPDAAKSAKVGHQQDGRTVCLHSLAVSPKLHGNGLGKLAMTSYIQIVNDSGVADRIALICQDYLVGYYKKFGFREMGESKAAFGGGGWYDMVLDLDGPAPKG
ncbi:hypothetical protein ACHAQH_009979 [Verticillium albo-atrum]